MKIINLKLLLVCFSFSLNTIAQQEAFNTEVNEAIWNKFTLSFETLDTNLFDSLHSEDFIRISGDTKTIRDKKKYIDGYKKRWQNKTTTQTISFRFLERINNGLNASERGIYKLTLYPNTEKEVSYYGEFHVVLRKEQEQWKLLVDYDSNPNNTVDDIAFMKANPQ